MTFYDKAMEDSNKHLSALDHYGLSYSTAERIRNRHMIIDLCYEIDNLRERIKKLEEKK